MANTNRYWIANYTATPNFNVAANWADNADGSGANTAPTAGDMVHFGHATTLAAGLGFGSCAISASTPSLAQFTTYEGYNKVSFTGQFDISSTLRTFTTNPTKNLAELGFKSGMVVSVTGCSDAANNDTYVIQTVGGILVMANIAGGTSMANESAGNNVTITYDPVIDLKGQTVTMNDTVGGIGTVMTLDSKIKNSTGTGTINFAGVQVSGGGGLYYKCGENLIFENRDSVRMSFTPTGEMNFDNGIYPVTILNVGTYSTAYITPTSTVHNAVNFYQFVEGQSGNTWNSGGTKRQNIKKIFNVENTTGFALLTKNFNTGQSTWSFDTVATFVIPTSGDYINYPTGFTVRWYNLIIKNTGGNPSKKATIPARRNLQVNSLTVEANANVEGEKAPSLSGTADKGSSTITSNTRPTIKGSWNFSQVADGVYASLLTESYSITPSHGDRRAVQLSYGGGAFDSHPKFNWGFDKEALIICDGAFISSSFYEFCQSYAVADGSSINNTIWITNATPSVPYFTDSQGNHHNLLAGGGGGSGTVTSVGLTGGGSALTITGSPVTTSGNINISGAGLPSQVVLGNLGLGTLPVNTDEKVKINALDSFAGYLENKIIAGTGLNTTLALAPPFGTQLSLNNESLAFKTIAVAGQTDVVADLLADTLTLVAGANMTLTTNAAADSITFTSTGGGGGGGVDVENSLVPLGIATTLNFDTNLSASLVGSTATISASGGGGGGGGYPLFKHDENPTTTLFSPFRKLVDGDTIEIGLSGSGKDVSVFTPTITTGGASVNIDTITATHIGSQEGREYIFFGQYGRIGRTNVTKYLMDTQSAMGFKTMFVHTMGDVNPMTVGASGGTVTTGFNSLFVLPMEQFGGSHMVRVIDAGMHSCRPLIFDPDGEEPIIPEEAELVKILIVTSNSYIYNPEDRRNPFMTNYSFVYRG